MGNFAVGCALLSPALLITYFVKAVWEENLLFSIPFFHYVLTGEFTKYKIPGTYYYFILFPVQIKH